MPPPKNLSDRFSCPHRLNASEFKPSRGQRRTVARINRYMRNQYVPLKISRESMVREDTSALDEHSPSPEPPHGTAHGPRRKSLSPPLGRIENSYADFLHTIHATDIDKMEPGSDWKEFKVSCRGEIMIGIFILQTNKDTSSLSSHCS